jgi:hypothetical protein
MNLSMLPIIFFVQILAIDFAARRATHQNLIDRSQKILINVGLMSQIGWAVASALLAYGGIFQQSWFLAAWPSFWVTFIAVFLVMLPWLFSIRIKDMLRGLIDAVPLHWIVGFQGLRILAIGGIIKAVDGEFSRYFAFYVGIPDLIFGLSALVMARLIYKKKVGRWSVALWNLIGAMIIVPLGLVLMQMGLPGAWRVFTDSPTIATIFKFPMALAPTVVVPIFVMMNLFVAMRLLEGMVGNAAETGFRKWGRSWPNKQNLQLTESCTHSVHDG